MRELLTVFSDINEIIDVRVRLAGNAQTKDVGLDLSLNRKASSVTCEMFGPWIEFRETIEMEASIILQDKNQ